MTVKFQELVGDTTTPNPNYGRAIQWFLDGEAVAAILAKMQPSDDPPAW